MRTYDYVGPASIADAALGMAPGLAVRSRADLQHWIASHLADREVVGVPATYVISGDGTLRVSDRRSEHVACAGGKPVLAAGEMFFSHGPIPRVTAATNLSTGYCPEPECWAAVAVALDQLGVPRPQGFTNSFVFRRCPRCGERSLVKDDDFCCAICGADLPAAWNFADPPER
jgi:hypothetical protein